MKAIQTHEVGGPETLKLDEIDAPMSNVMMMMKVQVFLRGRV